MVGNLLGKLVNHSCLWRVIDLLEAIQSLPMGFIWANNSPRQLSAKSRTGPTLATSSIYTCFKLFQICHCIFYFFFQVWYLGSDAVCLESVHLTSLRKEFPARFVWNDIFYCAGLLLLLLVVLVCLFFCYSLMTKFSNDQILSCCVSATAFEGLEEWFMFLVGLFLDHNMCCVLFVCLFFP